MICLACSYLRDCGNFHLHCHVWFSQPGCNTIPTHCFLAADTELRILWLEILPEKLVLSPVLHYPRDTCEGKCVETLESNTGWRVSVLAWCAPLKLSAVFERLALVGKTLLSQDKQLSDICLSAHKWWICNTKAHICLPPCWAHSYYRLTIWHFFSKISFTGLWFTWYL